MFELFEIKLQLDFGPFCNIIFFATIYIYTRGVILRCSLGYFHPYDLSILYHHKKKKLYKIYFFLKEKVRARSSL